jgi:hypothetical protein
MDMSVDEEERRKIAHTAWWGVMICATGAVVVLTQLIWTIVVALGVDEHMSLPLLMLVGPTAGLGMGAAVWGRIGIRTVGSQFVGSTARHIAHWGGLLLVVAAVVLFVISMVGLIA